MFGWQGDSLQRAMDKSECFYDGCGSIKKQPMATANKCKVQDFVGEETDGCKFLDSPVFAIVMLIITRAVCAARAGGIGYGYRTTTLAMLKAPVLVIVLILSTASNSRIDSSLLYKQRSFIYYY